MAEVFKAIKTGPDGFEKTIAIKRILPHYTDHPEFIRMLSTEAKIHSELNHPNIVQLYDFFQFQNQYMIAMEFVDGKNAKELIFACKKKGIPLPWQASVFIIIEVLKALHYAHLKQNKHGSMEIVHRDISPHNILISYEGRIKLTDFGIANAVIKEDKTKSGVLKGKYRYLSPEQVTQEEITPQTDLFSTGTTLYELLSFVHPFSHENEFELFKSIVRADYTPIQELCPDIHPDLEDILMLAMQPELDDRIPSAKDFLNRLLSIQDPEWISFGFEKMASLMQEAFDENDRIQIPIEPTKVLESGSVSIETEKSLLQLSLNPKKNKKIYWILPSMIIGLILIWSSFETTPPAPVQAISQQSTTTPSIETPLDNIKEVEEKQVELPIEVKASPKKSKPLKQTFATLNLEGPDQTQVFINGKLIGTLPMRQYFLEPDTYLILLKNKDKQNLQSISMHAGKKYHVSLEN